MTTERITADALQLLQASGAAAEAEDPRLPLLAVAVEEELRCLLGTEAVPPGLRCLAAERTAGRWLAWARLFAPEQLADLDLTQAVAEIQEGDTDVVFSVDAAATDAAKLEELIEYMTTDRYGQIYRYRKLLW